MKRPARPVTVAFAALLTVSLAALPAAAAKQELSPRVKVQGSGLPVPRADTYATAKDPANGKTPPTLVGQGFNGKRVTVEHNGIPRIVIFLSHSCPHCQAEVPKIVKLAKQGKLDGVEVDTITTNTSENLPNYPPSKWLKREHWAFKPVLADDDQLRAFDAYGGAAFPYFVFVSADGTVAARTSGEIPPSTIAAVVTRLVAGESLFAS